jgi:hypothetical protein
VANKKRTEAREAVINIRDSLNSHLNEDVEFTVDLSEVDELCQIIEEKDKKVKMFYCAKKDPNIYIQDSHCSVKDNKGNQTAAKNRECDCYSSLCNSWLS